MKRSSLILALFVLLLTKSRAQYGFDIMDSATYYFCAGDTEATIKYLTLYAESYPNFANTILVRRRLCEIYIERRDYAIAFAQVGNALNLEPGIGFVPAQTAGCKLFDATDLMQAKADLCVTLSRLYELQDNYQESLDYLNLADNKYMPNFEGQINGIIMYRTYLSSKYADLYLKMGDTSKATNRLLEYFMSGEKYAMDVAKKLGWLLRQKYSRQEIKTEMRKAIADIKLEKMSVDGEPRDAYFFTFFGHVQRLPFDNRKQNRNYLQKNEYLNVLKR